MRKRLLAVLATAAVALGIGLVAATPANAATIDLCSAEQTAAGYGGVKICYNSHKYTSITLQNGDPGAGFYVVVHDWTYDGVPIVVQYQPWGSSSWFDIPGSQDLEGGGVATSSTVEVQPDHGQPAVGLPIRYLRVHNVGGTSYSYLFRPTDGAGSGNGCGLEGRIGPNGLTCSYP